MEYYTNKNLYIEEIFFLKKSIIHEFVINVHIYNKYMNAKKLNNK
jgi:hypothetical protein